LGDELFVGFLFPLEQLSSAANGSKFTERRGGRGGGEPILELSLQLLEIQKLSFFFVELHLTHRQLFVQKVHLTQLVSMVVATEIKEATNLRVQLVDDPLVGSIGSQEILHLISRLRSLTPSQLRDAS
jgi:hypothetical protein